jgi:uncharacterized protein
MVLTNLRMLGHVFNPVSWWFCHDTRTANCSLIVAEVQQHLRGLAQLPARPTSSTATVTSCEPGHTKRFHVSPFLPIEGLDVPVHLRAA